MYAPFFGLKQEAFSIAPDPRFLFMSAMHREALAHLLYGLSGGGGFVLLTGEIGAGKTTVCRAFLEQVPAGHQVAYLYNPKLSVTELLQTVCQEFGIALDAGAGGKALVDALNGFMLEAHAAGRNCLLVIDEAQGLSAEVLEQLRLLTNLETAERKLLQIVLIGQPELRDMLARPEMEQLAQRVIARVHLGPLNLAEAADYVRHRMAIAGSHDELPFDARALALVHRLTGGVPRRINLLCQRALLGAYALGTRRIGRDIVAQAAREVFGEDRGRRRRARREAAAAAAGGDLSGPRWRWIGAALAVVAVLAIAAGAAWHFARPEPSMPLAQARATPADGTASAGGDSASSPVAARSLGPPIAEDGAAWQRLAAAWSVELPAAGPCPAARTQGLACHRGQADWALLKKLDRPALLELDGGGRLVLLSLSDTQARVQDAGGERVLPLATLEAVWHGRYATLWRVPAGWPDDGATRLTAATFDEVLARLTQLQGAQRSTASREETLRRRVFAFQVAQGLELDGVPGPITLMQLNRATGVDEPRLAKDP